METEEKRYSLRDSERDMREFVGDHHEEWAEDHAFDAIYQEADNRCPVYNWDVLKWAQSNLWLACEHRTLKQEAPSRHTVEYRWAP